MSYQSPEKQCFEKQIPFGIVILTMHYLVYDPWKKPECRSLLKKCSIQEYQLLCGEKVNEVFQVIRM